MESREEISYVSQQEALEIDDMLKGPLGFNLHQLMELAGLSVASAIGEVYSSSQYARVLVICGPGNNGGDGLVAARHLHHFGYKPSICYPKPNTKPNTKPLFAGLITQLESLSVPFLSEEDLPVQLSSDFDIIVDAIFGFSFHGAPKPPFDALIERLVSLRNQQHTPQISAVIISVDVPSGWHVEEGDVCGEGIKPDMLVSLTAPKLCAKMYCGPHHFLGGRFVPQSVVDKFKLKLPLYPGTSMCVRVGNLPQTNLSAQRGIFAASGAPEEVEEDPIDQFRKWLGDALVAGTKEPHHMVLSTASKDAKPSSRMISLEGVNKDGFVWHTNYRSRKAREISENPHASLLFYWGPLKCQVRVEGFVEQVSDEESEQYFTTLPRDIQIRPIISKQSMTIHGREVLHQQYKELEKYRDRKSIPRPEHWGGYRLIPEFFEFWRGEESQVYLKLRYYAEEIGGRRVWRIHRLVPQLAGSSSSL